MNSTQIKNRIAELQEEQKDVAKSMADWPEARLYAKQFDNLEARSRDIDDQILALKHQLAERLELKAEIKAEISAELEGVA